MNKGAWLYGVNDLRGEEEGYGGDLVQNVSPCLGLLRRFMMLSYATSCPLIIIFLRFTFL